MENMIVYVDDASYALQMLQPMHATDKTRSPDRWILVGCAPRLTHRASKWVTQSARESWRGKWADKVFSQLVPVLQEGGDTVVVRMAARNLCDQTQALINEYGVARVLDARRPKFGYDFQPVTASQVQQKHGVLGFAAALASAGVLVATD